MSKEDEQAEATGCLNEGHHWVSSHLPNYPLWVIQCDQCQQYDTNTMNRDLEALISAKVLEGNIDELTELITLLNDVIFRPDAPAIAKPALKSIKVDLETRIKELQS